MSAQNSTGIQTLLEAERQASFIVQKAREHRSKRVKDARDEAKQEIADYRASKEAEFKKVEAEHSRGNQAAEDEADRMADQYITEIKAAGLKNREGVVQNLLKAVFEVRPVAPVKA